MIYLASPYSDPDPAVMSERYLQTEAATAELLKRRVWVYSPIVHCHSMAHRFAMPTDAEFWRDYNEHMLDRADNLYVLKLPGWDRSVGVAGEMRWWRLRRDAQIRFISV